MTETNGNGNGNGSARVGTITVKQGLAQMLKGGVIVSVINIEISMVYGRRATMECEAYFTTMSCV
jgi:pyridoxal biosynthesis lyase PdxS